MTSEFFQEKQIVKLLVYHLNIFIIILLWFLYPYRYEFFFLIVVLCLFLIFCPIIIWREYLKETVFVSDQAIYILFIYFSFLYLFDATAPFDTMLLFFLFPFDKLVGINHNHNLFLFSVLFLLILVKLLPFKLKFVKNSRVYNNNPKNRVFDYFLQKEKTSRVYLFGLLIPLSAFVEEFIYRTLLLSFLINLFELELILSFIIVAVVFGAVHISTSKNWGIFIFTFVSSLIYSIALIFLGIIYAWILHLSNNLLAIVFFYSQNKKNQK